MSEELTRFFASRWGIKLARGAIRTGQFPVGVLEETVTSRENVCRAAGRLGCQVQIEGMEDGFKLVISR